MTVPHNEKQQHGDPRELLTALFDRPDRDEWTDAAAAGKLAAAVEAVLERHKPEDADPDTEPGKTFCCTGCIDAYGDYHTYPCATVQAITTALGATDA